MGRILTPGQNPLADAKRVVISLGGNAIDGDTPNRIDHGKIESTVAALRPLVMGEANGGNRLEVGVVHGNGPQVGALVFAQPDREEALRNIQRYIAETQQLIGVPLKEAIEKHWGVDARVDSTVATVGIFGNLRDRVKGIGPKVPGRPKVFSPDIYEIVGIDRIRADVMNGLVVIFGGGGGVLRHTLNRRPIKEAVGDKDRIAAKGAHKINANGLLTFTDTDGMQLDFRKPTQRTVPWFHPDDPLLRKIIESEAAAGSMGPKGESAVDFLRRGIGLGRFALIANLDRVDGLVRGNYEDWVKTTVISEEPPAYLSAAIDQWRDVEDAEREVLA